MVEPVLKFVVLLSGNGSNLQAVIDSGTYLPIRVTNVISNKLGAYGLVRARDAGIRAHVLERLGGEKREDYDRRLYDVLSGMDYDYILLLGWMRLLSGWFINQVGSSKLINLHPALPGKFPGGNAIEDAYKAGVMETGVMVHRVVEEVDAGEVLGQTSVLVYPHDTLEMLKLRVQYFEKFVLIKVISELVGHAYRLVKLRCQCYLKISGKVRDIYEIGQYLGHDLGNYLAILTTDRQSAFDRYICDIKDKGLVLSNCSAWWFRQTGHIISNHFVHNDGNVMIVRRCDPIKVEVVVRGYITGNTKTSLWTCYQLGDRVYCGHVLPDGLVKNQRLNVPLVTPTTKGIIDVPVSGDDIVRDGILSQEDWDFVSGKALELYEYGTNVAASKGLILVDTKYEFGRDCVTGEIILIDELHTCDSSRYWLSESYEARFEAGEEPEKYDKDFLRDYLFREYVDPYDSTVTLKIPEMIKHKLSTVYYSFYGRLVDSGLGPTLSRPECVVEDYFGRILSS